VADRQLFELMGKNAFSLVQSKLQCAPALELIRLSIRAMLTELSSNLYERVLARLPDYGHTFSPIFEFELSDLQHGEAVALDMAIATALAVVMGILDIRDAEQVLSTQHTLGLPIMRSEVTVEMLSGGAHEAVKARGGRLRMPLLARIGEAVFVDQVSESELAKALAFLESWSDGRTLEVAQSA